MGLIGKANAQYAIGDYGSTTSGGYSSAGTWSIWNGAIWVATATTPASGNNVFILTGRTVVLSTQSSCLNLTVETGAKLWTSNSAANVYLYVYGTSLVCNGQIGDGAIFDGISFGFEGAASTVTGSGVFDASRIRKNTATATTTTLTISRDVNLRFNSASTTQLYNNAPSPCIFNVTVSLGATVTFFPNGVSKGNVAIDGIDGVVNTSGSTVEAGGTYIINGTMNVSGKIYLTTNNANVTYKCNWIINGLVLANEVVASSSGLAGHTLTINSGGKLNITGTPAWSTLGLVNNSFTYNNGSTVEYSAAGTQIVRVRSEFGGAVLNGYYDLILSNTGMKSTLFTQLWVRNDLTITSSAILDPNPAINDILVGGNWINYNQSGFSEKNSTVWFNGSALETITCPGGEVYNILRYQKTGSFLQFNNAVDVITQLWFTSNGYVDLNSNTLTVRNNGTTGINGQTSTRYIVSEKTDNSSKIVWRIGTSTAVGPYTFPFGVPPGGPLNYVPVIIYKTTAVNIGDLSFSTYGTPPNNQPWPTTPTNVTNLWAYYQVHNAPDNRHWTVDRFWEIGSTNPNNIDTIRVSYRTSELPDSDQTPANLAAQFWAGGFNSWNLLQYGTGAANYVNIYPNVNPTIYYNTSWTLTSITSPLPIKLLSFDAVPEEREVDLTWVTASEINNEYFTVEKSIDGNNFYPIGTKPGAGNSSVTLSYSFVDPKPAPGISYYKLKQTDFDGHTTESGIVPVNYKKQNRDYSIFPNPVYDKAYLISNTSENIQASIRNIEGKLIQSVSLEGASTIHSIDLGGLSQGVYFIEVKSALETQFIRVVKN